jgi:uncharacterized membrane protein
MPASPRAVRYLAIVPIALGLFFRLSAVDHGPFWDDEVVTWLHVLGVPEEEAVSAAANSRHAADLRALLHPTTELRPISTVLDVLRSEDPQHPPAYYLLVHAWVAAFGNSLSAVRLLSALIGVLAIPCMYWLCVELFTSATAGWIGAALLATAPVDVLYAQVAREYGLWLVAILVSSALFVRALRTASWRGWGAYAGALAFSLYVFPLTAFVAGAHFVVALCADTSARNRTYAIAAWSVGWLLFVPWLLVILVKMPDINASMAVIIEPSAPRLQSLYKALALARLDIIDLNGAHRLPVLGLTVPILALLLYALYDARQIPSQASRVFVWALPACALLPLLSLDLFLGGHRVGTPRYSIPLFLGLDLALTALIARALLMRTTRGARAAFTAAFAFMFVARIASCAASAQAATWWNSYNIRSREVAAEINAAQRPLLVSDDYVVWSLTLSEYLDPTVEVALRPRCYLCKAPVAAAVAPLEFAPGGNARDVYLLAPSSSLQLRVRARAESEPQWTVKCINVRASCVGGIDLGPPGG